MMDGGARRLFTFSEVATHNNPKDCWLVIGGKVYDVTSFADDHPGGDDVLFSATGKDATDDFEDVGHSMSARQAMEKYYIGEIDASTIPTKVKYSPPWQPYYDHDKTRDFIWRVLQLLLPLAILGVAAAVRLYTAE